MRQALAEGEDLTPIEEQELREALDDVWGLLPLEEINYLDPGTVYICRHNHWLLRHQDAEPPTQGEQHDQHDPDQ